MAVNSVEIVGDTGRLHLRLIPFSTNPDMELRSASFRGSASERRVIGVFLTIPDAARDFELRFQFTSPSFAMTDLFGNPTQEPPTPDVEPYTEPRETRTGREGH